MLSQQSHDITDPMAAPQPDPQILGHLFAHIMSSDYSCLSLFGHSSAEGEKEIRSTIRHGTALPLLLSYALGASTCIGRILSKGKKAEIVEAAKDEERFIMGHFDMADAKQGEMLSKLIESLTQVASASISNLFTIARHLPHLQMWLVTRMYGPAEERQYAVTFPPREGWASKVDDDEAAETFAWQPPTAALRQAYLGLLRKMLEVGVSREVTWRLFAQVRKDEQLRQKTQDSAQLSPASSGRASPANGAAKRKRGPTLLKLRLPSDEAAAQEKLDVEVLDLLQHAMKARWPPAFIFGGGSAKHGRLELKETGRTWPKGERGLHFSVSRCSECIRL